MKITFIYPGIGKKKGERFIKTWKMEPLTVATLKALTPPDFETYFFDDRIELIDYDTETDLVAITVETYTAKRSYMIAKEFKRRGKKVLLGGYHVTLNPQEAMRFADSIVIGNAENVWREILNDFKNNRLKKIYKGKFGFFENSVLPDRSIFKDKKYLPLKLVETGRGCPFRCEFCAISSFYKAKYHQRDIKKIIQDIERAKGKYFFFVDDNIAGNVEFLKKLCIEIEPLKILWVSQGSLNVAKDLNLLKLMKKSGCQMLLIGFESMDEKNLKQMNKDWLLKIGERDELVRRIHGEGINIYATFVFGFDYDTEDTFKKALEFSLKHDFFFAAFNHLLPFPGTPLYKRLKEEKRLLKEKWWLDNDYRYGEISFIPKNFSPEELSERCKKAREEFFRFSSIMKRFMTFLKRKPNLPLTYTFLIQNLNLKKEVNEKFGIPLGENLDELPK